MTSGLSSLLRSYRIDLALALGVLVAGIAWTQAWINGSAELPPDAIGYALLVLIAAPVAFRNARPLTALLVVCLAVGVYVWLGEPGPGWTFAIFFAIWASVAAGLRLQTLVVTGAFFLVFLVAAANGRTSHASDPYAPLWVVGWLVASFVLGEVSRGRREYLEQVEQRAMDAERTREEEARRRAGEERLRIARELHDVLAHHISVINVQAGVAVHLIDRHPEQARTALIAIRSASKEAIRDLRSTLGVLREVDAIDSREPAPDLGRLDDLVATTRATGLDVALATTGQPRSLPPAIELAAYRIVQESLTNATRHSGASHVSVAIGYRPEEVEIVVEDDGRGLASGTPLRTGHGLAGMRERAASAGGNLEVGPLPGGGFRVQARLPTEAAS